MPITCKSDYLKNFLSQDEINAQLDKLHTAHKELTEKSGAGNDFLGWYDLPFNYDKDEFERIKKAAAKIQKDSDIFIAIGIGGSYLGARAAIEFIKSPYYNNMPETRSVLLRLPSF